MRRTKDERAWRQAVALPLRLGVAGLLLAVALTLPMYADSEAATEAPAAAATGPIPDAEIPGLIGALEGNSGNAARAAIERIETSGDLRFAAFLIELLRAAEIELAAPAAGLRSAEALERLTGERFGPSWPAWVRWYAGTDLQAPPGFTDFKGRLLGGIHPAFSELLRDSHPRTIRSEEVVWGGVPYEGIPALDQPTAIPAAEADYLSDDEPVFGIALGGEARAYPLRILDWHEMANDVVGGVPFSLAYCTLCGSGIAFGTKIDGHETFDFGSSGFLMRSNKLMVDRQTRTLWNQLTGRPVLGKLAADPELALPVLPSVVTRWKAWRERHPETTVLSLETGHKRPYHPGAAYAGYFASEDTMFPVRRARDELDAKARIFGIERDGVAVAYPLESLRTARVVNDRVGALPVVIVADEAPILVDGDSVRAGPARYSAGSAVRAYARGERTLRVEEDGRIVDEAGNAWRVEEDALVGPGGEKLARTPGILAYWFGWTSYHPKTRLHDGGSMAKGDGA